MERGGLNTGDNVVLLYPPGKHTHTVHTPLIIVALPLFLHLIYSEKVTVYFSS